MAYLYAYAGQPWKTQAMVRRILESMYSNSPDGLSGNEDCGQMSAWYVLSALGFYPVAPGSTEYVIGSPLFDTATIRLENGGSFVVRAPGAKDAKYIHSARLNGAVHRSAFFQHHAIAAGSELAFEMGAQPNRTWGVAPVVRPRRSPDVHVIPVPFVIGASRTFRGTQQVTLGNAERGVEIHYTLDGSTPSRTSPRYDKPIPVSESVTLKAIAFRNRSRAGPTFEAGREGISPVMSVTFRRLTDYPRITLSAKYAPQYAAAGDDTLIDGLRGNDSFKTGRWQGYRGTDLDITLDFGQVRDIRHVAMGFLQDTGSWIFMPRRLVVEGSNDGRTFTPMGAVENSVSERQSKAVTRDFVLEVPQAGQVRYLRLRVERYGKLPAWHPGAGNEAWFFADEIVVR